MGGQGKRAVRPKGRSGQPAGAYQARFVGQDHELGTVPGPELGHGPADVGPGCRRAHIQPFGDLLIGEASGHQGHHLALAFGEHSQFGRRPGAFERDANSATSLLVMPGEMSESPCATTRTAVTRSTGSVSLTRKPLAP